MRLLSLTLRKFRPRWKQVNRSSPKRYLQEWLPYMAILRVGLKADCLHIRLRCGYLDCGGFRTQQGDDVLCQDCGQVWAATEASDYRRQYASGR